MGEEAGEAVVRPVFAEVFSFGEGAAMRGFLGVECARVGVVIACNAETGCGAGLGAGGGAGNEFSVGMSSSGSSSIPSMLSGIRTGSWDRIVCSS